MYTTKPTRDYFDRPCESYEEFERIKAELKSQGFRYIGNCDADNNRYQEKISDEQASIEQFSGHGRESNQNERARKEHHFANQVEESTWDYKDQGFQVVRTQAFAVAGVFIGESIDYLVAFFIKPIAEK